MTDTAIDYTSKDYDGFRTSLLEYATRVMPEWRSRSEGDFGVVMVELFSYLADILSFYGDRVQQEAFLSTATQRRSMLQLAALLGYVPASAVPATGTVTFRSANPGPERVIPAGTRLATAYVKELDAPIMYETDSNLVVPGNGGVATAAVTQGETQSLVRLGGSNGLADQEFVLPHKPVLDGSVRVSVETLNGLESWSWIQHLIDGDATDHVFSTVVDENDVTRVVFGDNVSGLIPGLGLAVYASYRTGGGTVGNVLAGAVTSIVSADLAGVSIDVDNSGVPLSSAMTGGTNAEDNESIRRNAPLVYRTQRRAVTLQDFQDTALAVRGVTSAKAVANHFSSVTVYLTGPNGQTPTQALRDAVQDALESRAMLGVTVTVASPAVVAINVGSLAAPMTIEVAPRVPRNKVEFEVRQAVARHLASFGFSSRIFVGELHAAVLDVPGVAYVHIPVLARSTAAQTGVADIQLRDWEVATAGAITLTAIGGIA